MWQNDFEKQNKLSFNQCYETTKKSFKTDIDNNFSVIHIDTSEANKKKISLKENIYRFIDLYEYCLKSAKKSNKKIVCEMGTEEQSGFSGNSDDLENGLSLTKIFCKKKKSTLPCVCCYPSRY